MRHMADPIGEFIDCPACGFNALEATPRPSPALLAARENWSIDNSKPQVYIAICGRCGFERRYHRGPVAITKIPGSKETQYVYKFLLPGQTDMYGIGLPIDKSIIDEVSKVLRGEKNATLIHVIMDLIYHNLMHGGWSQVDISWQALDAYEQHIPQLKRDLEIYYAAYSHTEIPHHKTARDRFMEYCLALGLLGFWDDDLIQRTARIRIRSVKHGALPTY